MIMFFVLALLPIIVRFVPIKIKNTNPGKYPVYVFLAIFFLMLALRHPSVGNDTGGYLQFFDEVHHLSWGAAFKSEWEYGFVILTKLISYITNNSQVYLAIVSVIICVPFIYSYTRDDKMPITKISLYLILPTFSMAFSGLRQAIAISIGMFVFEAAKKKKLVVALLLSLLAITFHRSAILLLLLYPVYRMKLRKKFVPLYVAVFLAVFLFRNSIFGRLGVIFGDYYNVTIENTGAYTMLILFVFFAVFSFIVSDDNRFGEEEIGLRNLLLMSCLLQCFVPLNNLAMRFNYYFVVFIPLLIPKVMVCASDKWSQVARVSAVVLPMFFMFYFLIRIATGGFTLTIVPYHFFWEVV